MLLRASTKLLCSLLTLFAFCVSLHAQSPTGTLQGEVQDERGGLVKGAEVVITAAGYGRSIERHASTDSRGEFRMSDLRPGAYKVAVDAANFAAANAEVTVLVSSVRDILVTLHPGAVQQSINVHGEASSITTEPINISSAVHQGVISAKDLEEIPLAHRSFANIAYLVPGTEPVEPSDPTKARITAVSFGGSSGLNDQLTVDGGDNSDDYIGGFLQNFSPDAIQEFAVQTSQQNADTGRTTGGSVVLTTKHGTDELHGTLAFYERAAALNARYPIENPAPNPKQPFSRQNYVGALGGPVIKSKVWFFTSFEYVNENASIAYSPASQTQFNALAGLARQGLVPGVTSIPVPNDVPIPFNDALGTVRLDWSQSQRSQWFLRGAVDSYLTRNDLVQQATLASTGATSHANYFNIVLNNQLVISPTWLGSFTFTSSLLHHTETANSDLGFALAFPFSSTAQTISGFQTFGDNQFTTPITAFPVLRNQEKYQWKYDVSHVSGAHAPRFGIDFIHEPVLSGALFGNAENLTVFPLDPTDYANNPAQFSQDLVCGPAATPGASCTSVPATNGSFSQNVQRIGLYAEDAWRVTPHLTINYGLRYDTTFGLFTASGANQAQNPAVLTIKALQLPLSAGNPHDYRKAFAPRLGIAFSPGESEKLVLRAGVGLYYNDLAQNGWVQALQAVNTPSAACVHPGDAGCLPGAAAGGAGAVIDPHYRTPYALHAGAGMQYAINSQWTASADWVHEQGVNGYRRYEYNAGYTLFSPLFAPDLATQMANVPNLSVFKSDNRSRYDALMLHVQGNLSHRFNLTANYTYSSAKTFGCVLGELFDYVNGVCNPLRPFAPGDYGPSGEDVGSRFVLAGTLHVPGGIELTTLTQAEGARPITLTTPVDVNGVGDSTNDRAVINGVQTTLDQFRGTPYIQVDLRVARPTRIRDRFEVLPFIEFFNLFNRNNPGANYVTDISALPTPVNNLYNATQVCPSSGCVPITSSKQLLSPAGALGDFFGPGTTVGVPFAAQIGVRVNF
ncbi:MAG: TonB-dependent receptor [Acidobacteriaceae bacterium]